MAPESEFLSPSFGSVIRILGSDLADEGVELQQITRATYATLDEYVAFIRGCLKNGIKPILSREVWKADQFQNRWHMITVVEEQGKSFLIHDVGDGKQRIITEEQLRDCVLDSLGRELKIHKDFDTLIVHKKVPSQPGNA